jgi:phage-related protein
MTFEQFLKDKQINFETFLWADPQTYESLKVVFNLSHPESFMAQKRFLINKLRHKYPIPKV